MNVVFFGVLLKPIEQLSFFIFVDFWVVFSDFGNFEVYGVAGFCLDRVSQGRGGGGEEG